MFLFRKLSFAVFAWGGTRNVLKNAIERIKRGKTRIHSYFRDSRFRAFKQAFGVIYAVRCKKGAEVHLRKRVQGGG